MATTAEQLAALTATFEAFARAQDRYNTKADDDRSHMLIAIQSQGRSLDKLATDMGEVKPVTDMVTSLQSKLVGAGIVFGVIGAVAWGSVLFFKAEILRFLGVS